MQSAVRHKIARLLQALLPVCAALMAAAQLYALEVPFLAGHVIDEAGIISRATATEIEALLGEHEKQTGNQVVVLLIPSLEGEILEEFSLRAAETYKPGQRDRDNGVLLLIARDDRKLRIEVGYGLEGALTDALSSQIIRNEIVPRFRDGDFDAGVKAGCVAIVRAIQGEYVASAKNTGDGPGDTDDASAAENSSEIATTIGKWVGIAFGMIIGGSIFLASAVMGFGLVVSFVQHGLFKKSWWWFVFFGPITALLLMIPVAIFWEDAPGPGVFVILMALLIAFRLWMRFTHMGRALREKLEPGDSSGNGGWSGGSSSYSSSSSSSDYSSSSSSSSSGSSSYSGGGGSFGGGGASGSW